MSDSLPRSRKRDLEGAWLATSGHTSRSDFATVRPGGARTLLGHGAFLDSRTIPDSRNRARARHLVGRGPARDRADSAITGRATPAGQGCFVRDRGVERLVPAHLRRILAGEPAQVQSGHGRGHGRWLSSLRRLRRPPPGGLESKHRARSRRSGAEGCHHEHRRGDATQPGRHDSPADPRRACTDGVGGCRTEQVSGEDRLRLAQAGWSLRDSTQGH